MIFKLQRPIVSSDGNDDVLVYDESREYEGVVPMDDGLRGLFGSDHKIFVEGTVGEGGMLLLSPNKVQDPNW